MPLRRGRTPANPTGFHHAGQSLGCLRRPPSLIATESTCQPAKHGGAAALAEGVHPPALTFDQEVVIVVPAWSKSDAAVAHHHSSDAMPTRRGQGRVPPDLSVVVSVAVNPSGRHMQAGSIYFLLPHDIETGTHGYDLAVVNGNVPNEARRTGAIDYGASANEQLGHRSRARRQAHQAVECAGPPDTAQYRVAQRVCVAVRVHGWCWCAGGAAGGCCWLRSACLPTVRSGRCFDCCCMV